MQLEFFDKAYNQIVSKEIQRGLEGIVKECHRLGADKGTINKIVRLLGKDNEAVKTAAKVLDSRT